jgi:hypothetical protein
MAGDLEVDQKKIPSSSAGEASTLPSDKENTTESENEKQSGSGPEIEEAGKVVEVSTAEEFPHGLSLALIVVAIMLDTFLISLDQVRNHLLYFQSLFKPTLTWLDNCRYCNPQNYRPIRRSQQGLVVRLSILHDLRWLPDRVW